LQCSLRQIEREGWPAPRNHQANQPICAGHCLPWLRWICSALIAQAFEAVRYPILPKVTQLESEAARREILEIRHSSLYAPRDFDISPYFTIVKPTLLEGFNYKSVHWADLPAPSPASRHVWAAQEPSVP
jgi:hypothetical protein